jgi:hypothetical protein
MSGPPPPPPFRAVPVYTVHAPLRNMLRDSNQRQTEGGGSSVSLEQTANQRSFKIQFTLNFKLRGSKQRHKEGGGD